MIRRFVAFVSLVVACACVLAHAPAALAQARSIRDELPEEAKKDWDAAKELFEVGNYEGALVQYQRVYQATKNPRVLYNVGVCYKNLKRYARAISAWEKELTFRERLDPSDVTRLEESIEALQPFVSTLTVKSNEPGATVSINGDAVGETPLLSPVRIDVGRQVVRLEKEGFVPAEKTIDVARGVPARVELELVPVGKKTRVTIAVEGAERATLFMDGVELGPAPFEGEVPEGRHTFEARAVGFETARQTSEVVYGKPFGLTLSLVKARSEGKVKIVTGHEDAVIEVDGKVVGKGAWEGVLPAGGHQLVVRKDGYETHSSDLALSPGQDRTMRIDLVRAQEKAWIWWTVTTIAVAAGGGVASYFVFKPSRTSQVTGTLNPGVVTARFW